VPSGACSPRSGERGESLKRIYPQLVLVLCWMVCVGVFLMGCGPEGVRVSTEPATTPTPVGYLGSSITITMTNLQDAYGGPVPGKTFEETTCADLQALPYQTAAQLHASISIPLGVVVGFRLADGTLLKRRFYPQPDGSIDPPDSQTATYQSCPS